MHKRVGANTLKKREQSRSASAIVKKARTLLSLAKILCIAAVICGGAAFGAVRLYEWLSNSPALTVRSIEIRGTVRMSPAEIRRLSKLREGIHMFGIRPHNVEQAIQANCWIRRAHVSRRFPATVIIRVEERAPIALVNIHRIYYIDKEGILLPLFPATYSELPLISGIGCIVKDSVGGKIPETVTRRIVSLISGADAADSSLIKKISQIDFAPGSTVRVKLENSPMLVEIDDQKGAVQWKRFQDLLEVFAGSPEGMPKSINLCYSNLAFAQW